ncbi:ligand-binding sensor domain-containing diguanylate cyclase [Nevskia soli]|uniref:ligand-binding sensor domain-containing diguanylate cyclase n=1 Tax=Nevskia soli TaxID=418856 RepID=UPI0015D7583D|nr:diguanylate cyclase [Nevskia soli]
MAVCLACILMPAHSYAQRYTFRNYGQDDGLKNPTARAIAQDRQGYLWVGTRRGLYRFDGERFQEFSTRWGVPGLIVQSLKTAPNGAVWVAHRRGLARISGEHLDTVSFPDQVQVTADGALDIDASGTVYLATNRGVLVVRHPDATPIKAEYIKALPRTAIDALHVAPDGSLWISADKRLLQMNASGTAVSGARLGAPSEVWTGIITDWQGTLWLRSAKRLLARARGANRFEDRGDGVPESHGIAVLDLDSSGHLYVPTDGGIAVRDYGANRWEVVSRKQGLLTDTTTCMLQDREGSIWVGMNGGGLARWLGAGEWTAWTHDEGLASDIVWGIDQDKNGNLWVATDRGLTVLPARQGPPRTWNERNGLVNSHVHATASGPDGRLWIASAPGGLTAMDKAGHFQTFGKGEGLDTRAVYTLRFVGTSAWLGTASGIFHMNLAGPRIEFVREVLPDDDRYEMFSSVDIDWRGRLWAAGSHGVVMRDERGWHRIAIAGVKEAYTLKAGPGEIWVGSAEGGVVRISESAAGFHFDRYLPGKDLVSTAIYLIGIDQKGNVWAGGDAGTDVFDHHRWRNLSEADGLIWNDTDSNAFLADRAGAVWIGTSRGLSRYMPSSKQRPKIEVPITLNALDGDGREISPERLATQPWRDHSLTFHFNAVTFRNQNRTRFEFRLLPEETAWTETTQRTLRISTLEPNTYKFQVRARPGDEPVTATQSIRFTVPRPWWKTWPAIIIEMLFAAAVYRWLYQLWLRRLLARQALLEKAVQERTRELEQEKLELMQVREQLAVKATRDGLTGLWNRAAVCEILDRELHRVNRAGTAVAVILADIDFFKRVNDTYGHSAGDTVIMSVSNRLLQRMRASDAIGRYGGEELLLVLGDCDPDSAIARAEELRALIAEAPVMTAKGEIQMTCSFGLAVSLPGMLSGELIELADQALYRAKRLGRNRVVSALDLAATHVPSEEAAVLLQRG